MDVEGGRREPLLGRPQSCSAEGPRDGRGGGVPGWRGLVVVRCAINDESGRVGRGRRSIECRLDGVGASALPHLDGPGEGVGKGADLDLGAPPPLPHVRDDDLPVPFGSDVIGPVQKGLVLCPVRRDPVGGACAEGGVVRGRAVECDAQGGVEAIAGPSVGADDVGPPLCDRPVPGPVRRQGRGRGRRCERGVGSGLREGCTRSHRKAARAHVGRHSGQQGKGCRRRCGRLVASRPFRLLRVRLGRQPNQDDAPPASSARRPFASPLPLRAALASATRVEETL